jgi:hypothetical protein
MTMEKLQTSLSVARWIAAACVAYMFVHAGSGALTQVALSWHAQGALDSEDGQLLLFGLAEILATIGLFARSVPLRVVSAAGLLLAAVASLTGTPDASVGGWCAAVAAFLVLTPRIPKLRAAGTNRALSIAFAAIDLGDSSSNG